MRRVKSRWRCCACERATPTNASPDASHGHAPQARLHQMERATRSFEAHVLVGIEHVTVLGHWMRLRPLLQQFDVVARSDALSPWAAEAPRSARHRVVPPTQIVAGIDIGNVAIGGVTAPASMKCCVRRGSSTKHSRRRRRRWGMGIDRDRLCRRWGAHPESDGQARAHQSARVSRGSA